MPSLFLRDFTVLDYAYLGAEAHEGVQGDSVYVSVELEGDLDEKGFILDFGPAKKILKQLVDELLDHKLLVPALHPSLRGTAEGIQFGELSYEAPAEAFAMLEGAEISLPLIEAFLEEESMARLPANVKAARFQLREDPRFLAEPNFRYTHGLRLHEGNCQRLLHGHRNPVEVWIDGARSAEGEKFLAAEWAGAHFTYAPTCESRELDLPLGRRMADRPGVAVVAYEALQGRFRTSIPAAKIILLETEPSIENIARLGAERLRAQGFKGDLRVVAFEGLNKGASYQAL